VPIEVQAVLKQLHHKDPKAGAEESGLERARNQAQETSRSSEPIFIRPGFTGLVGKGSRFFGELVELPLPKAGFG
jgi:hypothetical protein